MNKEFTIKTYPKSELVLLYFPNSDPHVALNRLNSWIRRCQPLVDALEACYQTRHEQLVGAHAKGYNQHSIGICYEGGLTPDGEAADTRTPQQKTALKHLLKDLRKRYPQAHILGHRDLPNVSKACPCFDAEAEYATL